jgi:hypothetical protein
LGFGTNNIGLPTGLLDGQDCPSFIIVSRYLNNISCSSCDT